MISDYVLVFLGGVWMFRVEVLAIIGHCFRISGSCLARSGFVWTFPGYLFKKRSLKGTW